MSYILQGPAPENLSKCPECGCPKSVMIATPFIFGIRCKNSDCDFHVQINMRQIISRRMLEHELPLTQEDMNEVIHKACVKWQWLCRRAKREANNV